MAHWLLEGFFSGDERVHRHVLVGDDCVIGRDAGLGFQLSHPSVSRRHARIAQIDSQISIEDLGSSNGTYVNRRRIESCVPLQHGDIIHVGEVEMRLLEDEGAGIEAIDAGTVVAGPELTDRLPYGAKELEEILERGQVTAVFQAIVNNDNTEVYGYEILGRGTGDAFLKSPGELFRVAESVGLEVRLSEMMRNVGIELGVEFGLKGPLFVNTHPSELLNPDVLINSLRELKQRYPQANILLEVHEQAISDIDVMKEVHAELKKLDFLVAYDDFGAGQARLIELVEATPDILKFDLVLTRDLHLADSSKLELVKQLNDLAQRFGIKTLAECVSDPGEYEACQRVGFELYQGFLFDKPKRASEITPR